MAADNGQMSFRRGVMSLVILGLLKKEDMYGYQLVQETERQSGGRIVTQEGPLLLAFLLITYHPELIMVTSTLEDVQVALEPL